MDGDQLLLTVPAAGPYTRLARVAVTGLATRLGFSFDEVEELRLAVAEVCTRLIATAPEAESLQVRFLVGDEQLEVDIGIAQPPGVPLPDLDDLADQIVEATVDHVEFLREDGVIRITKTADDD